MAGGVDLAIVLLYSPMALFGFCLLVYFLIAQMVRNNSQRLEEGDGASFLKSFWKSKDNFSRSPS